MAYSSNGTTWTGLGTTLFTTRTNSVSSNGNRWVAGGTGGANTLAHSLDGITWTGLGAVTFSANAQGLTWNGSRFIAVGSSNNTVAISGDGINWTGLGTTVIGPVKVGGNPKIGAWISQPSLYLNKCERLYINSPQVLSSSLQQSADITVYGV